LQNTKHPYALRPDVTNWAQKTELIKLVGK
jgi:hypothetical protein